MKSSTRLQVAIFGVGALASLVWAYSILRGIVAFASVGSGGLGAVSGGVSEALLAYVLLPVGVNLALIRWARRRGRTAVRWRWIHLLTTLTFMIVTIGAAVILVGEFGAESGLWLGGVLLALLVLSGLALPAQLLFAAGYVALALVRPGPGNR